MGFWYVFPFSGNMSVGADTVTCVGAGLGSSTLGVAVGEGVGVFVGRVVGGGSVGVGDGEGFVGCGVTVVSLT